MKTGLSQSCSRFHLGMVKTGVELKLDFKVALKAKALLKATAALLWMVAVKPKKAKPELRVAV